MGPESGAGDAETDPAPQQEQPWGFLLNNCDFFCVCVGFFAGFLGRGVRGGGSMANLLCE